MATQAEATLEEAVIPAATGAEDISSSEVAASIVGAKGLTKAACDVGILDFNPKDTLISTVIRIPI